MEIIITVISTNGNNTRNTTAKASTFDRAFDELAALQRYYEKSKE